MSKLEQKASDYANAQFNPKIHSENVPNFHCTDLHEAFLVGYGVCQKEYEEKLSWIPVEKCLPKTYSAVLAVIKSPNCTWVEEIGFGEGKFQLPGRGNTEFVTHWMYLPEPPSFL